MSPTRLRSVLIDTLGGRSRRAKRARARHPKLAAVLVFVLAGAGLTATVGPAAADTGGLVWPANGSVSQTAAEHKQSEGEYAVDIASWTANNPVVAAAAGTVVVASVGGNTVCYSQNHASNGLGNYVTIRHQNATGTTYTTYAHLASESVSVGQGVGQGQQIGIMGSTGCSSGPHVHFAVSTCQGYFGCSEWVSPDPADGTSVARGGAIANSSYPGVGTSGGTGSGSTVGSLDRTGGWQGGNVFAAGWALDPDAKTTATTVHAYLDGPAGTGTFVGQFPANQPRADVATALGGGTGPDHGFAFALRGIAAGHHTLYVYAINIAGGGDNSLIGSAGVDVANATAGSPFGSYDVADGRVGHVAHLAGWAADPSAPTIPINVHVYADGWPGGGGTGTDLGPAAVRRDDVAAAYPGYGYSHGFDTNLGGLTPGLHTLWMFAINSGAGDNVFLGERDVVVPGPAPIGSLDQVAGGPPSTLQLRGWTIDPDSPTTPTAVHVYLDGPAGQGRFAGQWTADWARGDVAAQFPGAGAAHGFLIALPNVPAGTHSVYVYAIDTAGGGNPEIGHASVSVAPAAVGSPFGFTDMVTGHPGGVIRVTGWGADPDAKTTPVHVHAYVDGWAGSGVAGHDLGPAMVRRDDVASAYPGYGSAHGFDATLTGLSPGKHMVWLYLINASGGGDNPLMKVAVTVVGSGVPDTTAPTISVAAQPAVSLATSMTVTYSGADASSGVWNYDVRYLRASYNTAFGALQYPSTWQRQTAKSIVIAVARGTTTCISARTRDNAGNVSAWSPQRCTAIPLDDRSLSASTGWTRRTSSAYYAGTATVTGAHGAYLLSPTVTTNRVALLATKCASCGSLTVYVGATKVGTISLYATSTYYRSWVVLPVFSLRSGRVKLVVTSATGKVVQVDGIVGSRGS